MIPFNKPFIIGKELEYIKDAVQSAHISGDGKYSKMCHEWFESRYEIAKALLTTSCTDALEMSALLLNIQPGDEVIIPSFTFVSTANAFVLRGAKIVFADSKFDTPHIDPSSIVPLITNKTKAIVPVHYAGISCDIDTLMSIASEYKLHIIEDAAQAIESSFKGKQLGTFGTIGTYSFHETKNVISGEGGLIAINNPDYIKRAEIIREKGTNRSAFFRGEVDKYNWVDIGSSFLPSEIVSAFLYAQLEWIDYIQIKRLRLWHNYYESLKIFEEKEILTLPKVPSRAKHNGHIFYIICRNGKERHSLLQYLQNCGIHAVFHYQSLHKSPYYHDKHDGRILPNSDMFSDCLLRLPMFYELTVDDVNYIVDTISKWANGH